MKDFAAKAHTMITEDLEATLALDKAAVTSNCPQLCRRLRDELGEVAGPEVDIAAFLGVDVLNGRKRSALKRGSRWKARQKTCKAKRRKLTRLAKGIMGGVSRVFVAGALPAATYGAEILGVSDTELEALRSTAKRAMTPHGKARSASALFVARGDPTWRPAAGLIVRWAQEVWWSETPRGTAANALTIDELSDAWTAASSSWPAKWSNSRGAMDTARLSAKRIGWQFNGPFSITTDQGVTLPLRETSPVLVAKALKEATQRRWQRKLATKLRKDGFEQERVCPDPVTSVTSSKWARQDPLSCLRRC